MNVHFNPEKLKFLIEAKGNKRPNDKELAELLNVSLNTIARWKVSGMPLYDKVFSTGIRFNTFMRLDAQTACMGLGYAPITVYRWNKKIPIALTNLNNLLKKFNILFEDIYI